MFANEHVVGTEHPSPILAGADAMGNLGARVAGVICVYVGLCRWCDRVPRFNSGVNEVSPSITYHVTVISNVEGPPEFSSIASSLRSLPFHSFLCLLR